MQAISRFIGTETGLFHSPQMAAPGPRRTGPAIRIRFRKIAGHIQHLIQMMAAWEMFFALEHIVPFRLTYEQLTADPEAALRSVARFCDVPLMGTVKIENEFEPRLRNDQRGTARPLHCRRPGAPGRRARARRPRAATPRTRGTHASRRVKHAAAREEGARRRTKTSEGRAILTAASRCAWGRGCRLLLCRDSRGQRVVPRLLSGQAKNRI